MVLGEEFQLIPSYVHQRFMFGLRNVNMEEPLANRTMLISSLRSALQKILLPNPQVTVVRGEQCL